MFAAYSLIFSDGSLNFAVTNDQSKRTLGVWRPSGKSWIRTDCDLVMPDIHLKLANTSVTESYHVNLDYRLEQWMGIPPNHLGLNFIQVLDQTNSLFSFARNLSGVKLNVQKVD